MRHGRRLPFERLSGRTMPKPRSKAAPGPVFVAAASGPRWNCTCCRQPNAELAEACRLCGTDRPPHPFWLCPWCHAGNWLSRDRCRRCHGRPRWVADEAAARTCWTCASCGACQPLAARPPFDPTDLLALLHAGIPVDIARVTVGAAPLPDGWHSVFDPAENQCYFFCTVTGETSWSRPSA